MTTGYQVRSALQYLGSTNHLLRVLFTVDIVRCWLLQVGPLEMAFNDGYRVSDVRYF